LQKILKLELVVDALMLWLSVLFADRRVKFKKVYSNRLRAWVGSSFQFRVGVGFSNSFLPRFQSMIGISKATATSTKEN
jgi:hypothetical protein